MALRTFEIRKNGEGYTILEQAGSNYHRDMAVHESPNREDAQQWLSKEGGAPDLVNQALDDAATTERVFVEMVGDYSESEDFPKL
jgi:hypothetical protein